MQNTQLKKAISYQEEFYKKYKDWKYTQSYKECSFLTSYTEDMQDIKSFEINNYFLHILQDLALYHMEYSQFLSYANSLNIQDIEHLKISNQYATIMLYTMSQTHSCICPAPSIWMKNGGFFFSLTILSSTKKNIEKIGDILIDSINGDNSVIGYGHPEHTKAWFILDLYCKVFSKNYSEERAYLPDDYIDFKNILNVWDTTDLITVELLVYALCELHLNENITTLKKHIEQEEDGEAVEYVDVNTFIIPYEVLAWLKLRELKGLKNPTKFSHPLMKTPIAKMFLNIKEPLPKPTELPYAKELLEKLKERCPDVEVPEWLGEEKEKQKEPEFIPTIHLKSRELAPKTGRYQPTLPKGHPYEAFVKEPRFIKRVAKDETIGTFGLTGGDEALIVWVYLGE